jgi:hypothetical protein
VNSLQLQLRALMFEWEERADACDVAMADTLRQCAQDVRLVLDGRFDTESSASCQHFIDRGRFLLKGETE